MPKKFAGENTKAAEARARKSAKKEEEDEKRKQEKEDALWVDDDKTAAKKMQRKEEKLKKQQEEMKRKLENKALLEKEMEQIAASKGAKDAATSQKITQAEINAHHERVRQERQKQDEKQRLEEKKIAIPDDLLTENVNRLLIEGESARTVDEALQIFAESAEATDRNPEKRMKAAYTAYEEQWLPALKAENPNLRLSQLKQMLKKQWLKAPENPMNQQTNEA